MLPAIFERVTHYNILILNLRSLKTNMFMHFLFFNEYVIERAMIYGL